MVLQKTPKDGLRDWHQAKNLSRPQATSVHASSLLDASRDDRPNQGRSSPAHLNVCRNRHIQNMWLSIKT
jgi:hypothetical protein